MIPPVLTGISLGYFMVLLDLTVLAVAEPDLAASLGASLSGLQWATTAYTVAFAALLLSAGAAADRYGADRLFRAGIAVFTFASLLSAAAPGLPTLVALRVVAGVAAAACVPASLALIAHHFPEPAARARAISAWAAISGAAVAFGPVAGGALVAAAGWRAVFLVNVPIGLAVLALTRGAAAGPRTGRRIDWPAQLTAAAGLALATDAVIAAGAGSWAHVGGSVAGLSAAALLFRALERRSRAPVLDRALLRSAGVRAGLLAAGAVNFALTGGLFVLPLLLQRDRHLGPLASGLALLPLTVPFVTNPPLTGRIVARVGPRAPILAGLALLTAGGAALSGAVFAGGGYPWLVPGLLLTGFGVSSVLPALVDIAGTRRAPGHGGRGGRPAQRGAAGRRHARRRGDGRGGRRGNGLGPAAVGRVLCRRGAGVQAPSTAGGRSRVTRRTTATVNSASSTYGGRAEHQAGDAEQVVLLVPPEPGLRAHLEDPDDGPDDGEPDERAHQPAVFAPLGFAAGHDDRPAPADQRLPDRRGDQQRGGEDVALDDAGQVEVAGLAGAPGDHRAEADAEQAVDGVPDRALLGQPDAADHQGDADRGDQGRVEVPDDVDDNEDHHRDAGLDQPPPAAELLRHHLTERGQLLLAVGVTGGLVGGTRRRGHLVASSS